MKSVIFRNYRYFPVAAPTITDFRSHRSSISASIISNFKTSDESRVRSESSQISISSPQMRLWILVLRSSPYLSTLQGYFGMGFDYP